MITNILATVFFIIASYITGYAFLQLTHITDPEDKYKGYVALPVGVALNAVVASFVYFRLGTVMNTVRIVWLIISLAALIYILVSERNRIARQIHVLFPLLMLLVLFAIMIVPGLYRGCNYYVYKGNLYDKYGYLSETAYMATHEITYGDGDMLQEEYYPDAFDLGYFYIVNDRPAASLICAEIAFGGDLFFAGYMYVTMIWAMISGSMILILRRLFPYSRPWQYVLFALIYVFGMQCQLQNDLDTWSQQTACSMLITFTAIWLTMLHRMIFAEDKIPIRQILGMGIFGTGVFMIYAEATWAYGLILVIATIIMFFITHSWSRYRELLKTATIPVQMLGLCYIAHPGTFICAFTHILFATDSSNQTWTAFYSYWKGYHEFIASSHTGAMIKQLLTIVPCWSGMYMITPVYAGIPSFVIAVWLLALGVLSVGVIALIIYTGYYAVKQAFSEAHSYKASVFLTAIIAIAFFAVWIVFGQYFTASKSVLFISPLLYLVLAMPLMNFIMGGEPIEKRDRASSNRLLAGCLLAVSLVYVVCQIGALGLRVGHIMSDKDGIMALGEYYPRFESQVKQDYDFSFDASAYHDEEVVAIVGGHAVYQLYVKMCLAYEGVDYYTQGDWGGFDYTYSEGMAPRAGDAIIYIQDYEKHE